MTEKGKAEKLIKELEKQAEEKELPVDGEFTVKTVENGIHQGQIQVVKEKLSGEIVVYVVEKD